MNTPTTCDQVSPLDEGYVAPEGRFPRLRRAFRRMMKSMLRSYWKRRTVEELSSLPPHVMRDIGLLHEDIHDIASGLAREHAEIWARRTGGANGFGG